MTAETGKADQPAGQPTGQDIQRLLSMIEGFINTQLVAAAARLGLPDRLAGGPRGAAELAEALGADPRALLRFLRAAASIGLLEQRDGDLFAITPMGRLLASGEGSLRNYALSRASKAQTRPWERAAEAATGGRPTTGDALGVDLWEYYRTHGEERELFAATMTDLSAAASRALVPAYDFTPFPRIVDVGGSHGTLLTAVLAATPESTGVLFDQPDVVESARPLVAARGLADRIEIVPGSFLDEVPGGGDLYLIKQVLCDWDDEHAARILANTHRAAPSGSTVVVIDWVLPEAADASPLALNDFGLLVAVGGRIRTEKEYRAMLEDAGFEFRRVITVPGHFQPWNMIEARKG